LNIKYQKTVSQVTVFGGFLCTQTDKEKKQT